jgi:hypothetical protein
LEAIARVFAKFEPHDPIARNSYLFTHHPTLPEGRDEDFHEHHRIVSARRIEAAREWYAELGAEGIVRLSTEVERSDALGDALAEGRTVPSEDEPGLLRAALEHPEFRARVFGRAYLGRRFAGDGAQAISTFLRHHAADWAVSARAEALLAMAPGAVTWGEAEALGDEGRSYYWQNMMAYRVDDGAVGRAMRELARHGRPHAAIDLAAMHVRLQQKPHAGDVAHVLLEAAPLVHDVTGYRSQSYDVSELVTFLEHEADAGRIAEEDVARLELLYLPLLEHGSRPKLLHKAMAKDPSLFIDAACLAFRGEGESERELDDAARGRALLAGRLLDSWRTPPGLEEGVVNGERLSAWVDEARRRLAEANRSAIGDQLIGQVLSGSPTGADGAWPAEVVRDLIDRLKSDDLEAGLHMGRFNQRGVVSRGLLSGGDLERSIKERYEADASAVAARWPRTAAFLRTFAATYERDAAREDAEAELRHDLED